MFRPAARCAFLIAAGKATFVGDRTQFDKLRAMLVQFTPDFEMVPGTRPSI
jgi:hypothetical protein